MEILYGKWAPLVAKYAIPETELSQDIAFVATVGFVGTFLIELVLHFGFVNFVFPEKTRYFFLHVMFNGWLSWFVFADAMSCLRDPESSMNIPYVHSVVISTAAISGFHIYHMIFFTNLTTEDVIHHLVSCVLNVGIGIVCPFGKPVALSNLVMCGIPGGTDYFLLTLVKCAFSCLHLFYPGGP